MTNKETKPRVLIVITLAEVGGAQSYVIDLLPRLAREFDVTVAAHGPGPLAAAAASAGARYVPLRHVRRPVSPFRDLLGLVELWRLCRRLRPDVLHANSSKAGVLGRLAAALAGVPVRVFTAHGWAFKASAGRSASLYLAADRTMRRLTDAVVCVSDEELRSGLAAGTCTSDGAVVIRNGIDAGSTREAVHAERAPVRVVSVGRLAAPKDFRTLLEAVASLERGRIRLTVLGDGPLRSELEGDVRRLGLDGAVELPGEVDDVRARLAAFDVFALSSRSEGLPISLLEASAAGLPVVASRVGGVPEVVDDGVSGFLVPAGDAGALAERLDALCDDVELRARLGRAGRERVAREFSLERSRDRHVELYRGLLAGRRAA